MSEIQQKAICVFSNDDKILVAEYNHFKTGEPFYRPLGGNIEFTEHSKQALKREIYEELQAEVCQVELLDVIENIYYYKEKYSHELMFVYDGVFEDESFYEVNELNAFEKTDGRTFKVKWKSLEDFIIGDDILYPEGLLELLVDEFSIDYPSIFIESQESEVSIKY